MKPQLCHTLSALTLTLLAGTSASTLAAEAPQPGKVFKDCKDCPEMVVLPAGTFTMGTPDDELGRQPDEGPMHDVTFKKAFAISRFQIQNGEWHAYLRSSGYKVPNGDTRPGRECIAGKPRYPIGDKQPAVCLSFFEAEAYAAWLSKKTGKAYTVQSEAQREYAVRGGTTGPFPFPFDEGEEYSINKHANTYGPRDGFSYTSPVGSFPPNAYGMYDGHGNVYEWTRDCYVDSYQTAPTDGSPQTQSSECRDRRVIRGNDYTEAPIFSRSGNRNERGSGLRGDWLGFRVVREL
ncbi:formylglycine-generating enzyme family protein [Pseudomonas sp. S75]|uniref:formylglycine-generating enzyme family protein n=1 Tax=unclassified Pseudomonas TaxID=196821 RepID=UPI001908B5BF|nr:MULTISPECIES: formylglycine-generating enzyme family protein [unclassified Pseudomonas]MBJ9974996.1 formylglycine-generating enzyme family protein [Pseudomonas sp. S30]MBK0152833.1 formylglycine-generating enzyme family protein [Pseudomonas sp. S75]